MVSGFIMIRIILHLLDLIQPYDRSKILIRIFAMDFVMLFGKIGLCNLMKTD
jgi:hypothetical protein